MGEANGKAAQRKYFTPVISTDFLCMFENIFIQL